MSDQLYREIILEHWEHPQNYGVLKKPDIDITRDNPFCGDRIRIMAKVKNKIITGISFTSSGCAISTASGSILTDMVKGMSVSAFMKITPQNYLDTFQIHFSPARMKCALLSFFTLKSSLMPKRLSPSLPEKR